MTVPAGTRIGTYVIESTLGSGGMGVVYRAHDTRLERTVAIKFLSPVSSEVDIRRLHDEARAASALNHPHICTVHEFGTVEGQPFIVMEHVEGRRLSDVVSAGPLPLDLVYRYGVQMSDALSHAHEKRVVHGDLKPPNVIITSDGRAKVLDFGLAKRGVYDTPLDVTRTIPLAEDPGVIAGTLTHMAPELLRGGKADARSDIWALGVVLYEMATGRLPFDGATSYGLVGAIAQDRPASFPPRVPPALRSIIVRCLEKEPGQRYQRASEIRAALELLQAGDVTTAATDSVGASRHDSRKRFALAALALIVAGVAIGIMNGGDHP
jgi:serine/threonine protein kinase